MAITLEETLEIVERIRREADTGKAVAGLTQAGASLFQIGNMAYNLSQSLQHAVRDADKRNGQQKT